MPITKTSCGLCGSPITSPDNALIWKDIFRALYTVLEQWDGALVSGCGRRWQFQDVIPLDELVDIDLSESIVDDTWVQIELMKSSFGQKYPPNPPLIPIPLWGFPFHSACWEILSLVSSRSRHEPFAQPLFDICRSQPVQMGVMQWGHDYEGLIKYNVNMRTIFPGEELDLAKHTLIGDTFTCDPFEIPQLSALYLDTNQSSLRDHPDKFAVAPSFSLDGDPFNVLPTELLIGILVEMDSYAVARLRLASPVFASTRLPDTFWRSRFWPGRELAHVFEAAQCQASSANWEQLFHKTKALTSFPSMVNRKRIWKLACRLNELVEARLECSDCHGDDPISLLDRDSEGEDHYFSSVRSALCHATQQFSHGSRSLYNRAISLYPQPCRIWLSSIEMNSNSFISGLRFITEEQDLLLGYQRPQQEQPIIWEDSSVKIGLIPYFHVAVDARGIRGLRAVSQEGVPSMWLGDHHGIPKKMLVLPSSDTGSCVRLEGGFDALKLVSLSVYGTEQTVRISKTSEPDISVKRRGSALWYPEVPRSSISLMGASDSRIARDPYDQCIPFSTAVFGGEDGQFLPYLSEISVWVVDNTSLGIYADHTHIWGIEFKFDLMSGGRDPMFLGQIPEGESCTVHRIRLESDKGERLVQVESFYEDPRFIFGFMVRTNYGRSMEFPPSCRTDMTEDDYFSESITPKDGTIIGLYSSLKSGVVFQNLGVMYIKSDPAE